MFGRRQRLRSKKYIRDRRNRLLTKSGVYFGILVLLLVLLSLVAHLSQFEITEIDIVGNEVINTKELHTLIEKELGGKYFWIFPRNNSIIFPRRSIVSNIEHRYRRAGDVDASFSGFNKIEISMREREPIGVWCVGGINEAKTSNECYFLDRDGYIFSKAPEFSGSLFFKYFGGDISEKIVGEHYLLSKKFKELAFFLRSLKDLGLYPVSYEWGTSGDSSILVEPKGGTKIDATVLFNNIDDLGVIFENLDLVLSDEAFNGIENVHLEYIDLRFGNKVYFK